MPTDLSMNYKSNQLSKLKYTLNVKCSVGKKFCILHAYTFVFQWKSFVVVHLNYLKFSNISTIFSIKVL